MSEPEKWARDLLARAAEEVEPGRRWEEIQRATTDRRTNRRGWWLAGGSAVAVAAVAAVAAVVVTRPSPPPPEPQPAGPSDTPAAVESTSPTNEGAAAAVYFAGDTPQGPRLYREFRTVETRFLDPVRLSIEGDAEDPDYGSLWPEGAEADGVTYYDEPSGGLLQVDLTDASLRERPAGMTEDEARLAIQQVVYTAQAEAGARAPVTFEVEGEQLEQVLGVPMQQVGDTWQVAHAAPLDTLSRVSLSDPAEGTVVGDGALEVNGAANAFEANVVLTVSDGPRVLRQEPVTASGWMGERLFPFETRLDLSGLPPGEYVLTARVDEPTEDPQVFSDTRTFVVE
ncbi:Gmad2 immunoglobulin-like domain-containing protein [Nocardioides insulae]|uniref:Gmad2 immunoglobulin-like domain-containing protein n=1 Tax=Nocardioides insulae TaxID=394734 RepID=UPI0004143137|nr:Gmad2 immunoglobulin-like domain-containing protein [Nocardioides insulae]